MEKADFLETKEIENHIEHYCKKLQKLEKSMRVPGLNALLSQKQLSKDTALLGRIILDDIAELRDNEHFGYYYTDEISMDSRRFQKIKSMASSNKIWEGKHYALLEFFFGEEIAPLVKSAWYIVPNMMYQRGYQRRSFRGPELTDLHYVNQINLIIGLIQRMKYRITLDEYILYSNQIFDYNTDFSFILAAAINKKDEHTIKLLMDILYGRHETGKVSAVIIKSMLLSDSKEAWIAVEKLLLSAQRQEGLRQIILECLDETSIGALKHMIKVLIEHKLSRFSSVVRAIDVWAGFGWESEREPTIRRILEFGLRFLEKPGEIREGIDSDDNTEIYMALWAQGVFDVDGCIELIDMILKKEDIHKTILVLHFVSQIGLSTFSIKYGKTFIEHHNLIISTQAIRLLNETVFIKLLEKMQREKLFNHLLKRIEYYPKKPKAYDSKVFSWLSYNISQKDVYGLIANLIDYNDRKEIEKILPYFENLPIEQREFVTSKILPDYFGYHSIKTIKGSNINIKQRDFALSILSDRAEYVRKAGFQALESVELKVHECEKFEALLLRKSADIRKQIIAIILKQNKAMLQGSIKRLSAAKNSEQRLAALDLLSQYQKKHGETESNWIDDQIVFFMKKEQLTSKEQILLNTLKKKETGTLQYSEKNGFGLFNIVRLKPFIELSSWAEEQYLAYFENGDSSFNEINKRINTQLKQLKSIYVAHADFEYEFEDWNNSKKKTLLGNEFNPFVRDSKNMSDIEIFNNYPLSEVWKKWYEDSGLSQLELFFVHLYIDVSREYDEKNLIKLRKRLQKYIIFPKIPEVGQYRWLSPISTIIQNLSIRYQYKDKIDFLEKLVTLLFYKIDNSELNRVHKSQDFGWGHDIQTWRDLDIIETAFRHYRSCSKEMDEDQFNRFWDLETWYIRTIPAEFMGTERYLSDLYNYVRAYDLKLINRDEMMWRIMKPDAIRDLTHNSINNPYQALLKQYGFLGKMLNQCMERIIEIELKRGDSSTPVSKFAQQINYLSGAKNFVDILSGIGNDTLNRGYIYDGAAYEYNKKEIFSKLLKNCFPSNDDDQNKFNKLIKEANIKDKRLIEATMYAPQWIPFSSQYLGIVNLASAVWWLHAHTNGEHSAETESEISRYSKIDINDFKDGAVDIDWFLKAYKSIGKKTWKTLYDAAKYVSDGTGHSRARLYADVILGNIKITEILKRIVEKRNQDYLRVYGLVPLSKSNPQKDLKKRYMYLQKFKKESRQFGSQRQASEAMAVKISMENLARTADYCDSIRLTWAMESAEASDIMQNKKVLQFENIRIELKIDNEGKSSIICYKDDKKIKSIPPKFRKDKAVTKLKEQNKKLRNQYSRTRKSLEDAMINGDRFNINEIQSMMNHPIVAPMLKKLVLYSNGHLGFWNKGQMMSPDGNLSDFGEDVYIAHCTDLNRSNDWRDYQRYCFNSKIIQPFKQVFRELYIITEDERAEVSISRRYAGHQVQPKKTIALLKSQGWRVDYEEGLQKVFHQQNFIAKIYAQADWFSPAEVESPTLETISFLDRKTFNRISFDDILERIFSEVMRDIDLVVCVAHIGEVDPEASHSSIEMRRAIINETLNLFKIDNVIIEGSHAIVNGENHQYNVHLGSGVVHKVPGIYLSILPVHSHHRGRIFLPFIDDDPKTAEIISKILLLAKDNEIKDPTILKQLD